MKYWAPYGAVDPNASYINGNPATSTQGSVPPGGAIEQDQREIVNAITSSGQTPSEADLFQLWKAMQRAVFKHSGNFGSVYLALDGANLRLSPYEGTSVLINGEYRDVPALGVALAPTGTAATTLYHIYAYWTGSAVGLEYSATGPVLDATYGHMVKSGDASRTYVGSSISAGAGVWNTDPFMTASFFNPQPRAMRVTNGGQSTTASNSWSEIPSVRKTFMIAGDVSCLTIGTCSFGSDSASMDGFFSVGFDSVAAPAGTWARSTKSIYVPALSVYANKPARGSHYATGLFRSDGTNTMRVDNIDTVVLTAG